MAKVHSLEKAIIHSLEKAMQERQARRGVNGGDQGAQPEPLAFAIEGSAPAWQPHAGEVVEFVWADPALVGSPQLVLGFLVSRVIPDSKDGRVNGWCIMDPTMQLSDPHGRPVQVPPLVPIVNAAYSRERKPLTWRFRGDANPSPLVAA